jgi:hypothetical protein
MIYIYIFKWDPSSFVATIPTLSILMRCPRISAHPESIGTYE